MSISELIAWGVVAFGLLPVGGTALFMLARPFRRKSK